MDEEVRAAAPVDEPVDEPDEEELPAPSTVTNEPSQCCDRACVLVSAIVVVAASVGAAMLFYESDVIVASAARVEPRTYPGGVYQLADTVGPRPCHRMLSGRWASAS